MKNIVDTTLFKLETSLPYLDNPGGSLVIFGKYHELYTQMIQEHEPDYLKNMFGQQFTEELYQYINDDLHTPDERLDKFIEIIKIPASYYCFCKIMENWNSLYLGTVSVKQENENSTSFPNSERYVMVWNRMVRKNYKILHDLTPDFISQYNISTRNCNWTESVKKLSNSFGI